MNDNTPKPLKYQGATLLSAHRQSDEVYHSVYNEACRCAGEGEILNPADFAPYQFSFDRVRGLSFPDGKVVIYSISDEGEIDAELIGFQIIRRSKKGPR